MAALNPYEYGHIIPWYAQFLDINGQPLSGGYVEIYEAGTTTPYISFQNFDGTPNPFRIQLTTGARTVAIGKISKRYDIYVYNQFGNLEYSRLNIGAGDSEGVNLTFTSSDGSIIITRDGNTVDLVVKKDEDQFGTVGGATVDENGKIIFNTVESGDITVNAGNIEVEALKLYHITVHLGFEGSTAGNSYLYCKLVDSEGGEHKFSVDNSRSKQWVEVSWDIRPSRSWISLTIDGLDTTTSLSKATVYIHRVNPIVGSNSGSGGATYTAGYGINISGSNEISANINELRSALTTKAWHNMHGSTWSDNGDLLGYIVENSSGNYDPDNLITIEKWTNEDSEHNVLHYGKINLKAGHSYMLVSSMWFSRKPDELAPTLNNIAFYVGGTALGINGARQEFLYNNSQMNEVCPQVTAFIPASNVDTYITLQCSGGVEWYDFKPDYLWIAALN